MIQGSPSLTISLENKAQTNPKQLHALLIPVPICHCDFPPDVSRRSSCKSLLQGLCCHYTLLLGETGWDSWRRAHHGSGNCRLQIFKAGFSLNSHQFSFISHQFPSISLPFPSMSSAVDSSVTSNGISKLSQAQRKGHPCLSLRNALLSFNAQQRERI